jgi:hypothetical protein
MLSHKSAPAKSSNRMLRPRPIPSLSEPDTARR